MTDSGQSVVEEARASDVKKGQTIWAQDDSDWLKVNTAADGWDQIIFFRTDGSEAAFRPDQTVLVLVR